MLIIWAVLLKAPLEQPATSAKAPNPVEGPLVLPRLAGNAGLLRSVDGGRRAADPDHRRPDGHSLYRLQPAGQRLLIVRQRKFAVTTFMFGFLVLWVTLIVLGTFLRGPNWNFFGPFEYWDPHKVMPLNNVNLSRIVLADTGWAAIADGHELGLCCASAGA